MTGEDYKLPEEEGAPPMEEALARRLFAFTQWRNFDYKFAEIDWMEADREYCRAIARECLRQMEWARNYAWSRPKGLHGGYEGKVDPLTLAPEDWKP